MIFKRSVTSMLVLFEKHLGIYIKNIYHIYLNVYI